MPTNARSPPHGSSSRAPSAFGRCSRAGSGLWWVPNRGLFRAEAARRIGGLRRHLAGEYSADWPWLLHMALLGEFARVPEPLVRKVFRKDGLSVLWGRDLWRSTSVLLACAREVHRARPPRAEATRLYGELIHFGAAALWGNLTGRMPSRRAR